jgi:hypothetical protein
MIRRFGMDYHYIFIDCCHMDACTEICEHWYGGLQLGLISNILTLGLHPTVILYLVSGNVLCGTEKMEEFLIGRMYT